MIPVLLDAGTSFIASIFNNIASFVKAFGSYAVLIIGIALIITTVVYIVKGFVVGKTAWSVTVCSLLFGGILIFGGWSTITSSTFGTLGSATLSEINEGNSPSSTTGTVTNVEGTAFANSKKAVDVIANIFFVPFGRTLAVCTGVLLIVIAVYQIAVYFFKNGNSQLSVVKLAAMALIGSVLFTATPTRNSVGWTWIRDKLVGAARDSVGEIVDGNERSIADNLEDPGTFKIKPVINDSDGDDSE